VGCWQYCALIYITLVLPVLVLVLAHEQHLVFAHFGLPNQSLQISTQRTQRW